MAQPQIKQQKVKQFAKEFVKYLQYTHRLPVERAYVFGSYVKGRERKWSDIDVCIVSKKFRRTDPLMYLWTRRRDVDIERRIEPYGVHPEDFVDENPIAYEIKKYGILL